jgi:hypothetical protein
MAPRVAAIGSSYVSDSTGVLMCDFGILGTHLLDGPRGLVLGADAFVIGTSNLGEAEVALDYTPLGLDNGRVTG